VVCVHGAQGHARPVVSRLDSELRSILSLPEIKSGFDKQGMEAALLPRGVERPDAARLRALAAIIKKNNITAE